LQRQKKIIAKTKKMSLQFHQTVLLKYLPGDVALIGVDLAILVTSSFQINATHATQM